MKETIALIDDDRNILTSISIALEKEGFGVQTYLDGESALIGLARTPPDLAVIDIKMPKMDGEELLKKLRKKTTMPVIFLTSKDDEIDEIMGLRMGADDYIKKPFSQRLLMERVKAVLRRHEVSSGNEINDEIVRRNDLVLDPSRHRCTWKEMEVNLTVTEFLLIQSLTRRPGHVKSRDQLIDAAYGDNMYVDDRTIDSHIKRLRRKFKDVDDEYSQIETLYGVGYRYNAN